MGSIALRNGAAVPLAVEYVRSVEKTSGRLHSVAGGTPGSWSYVGIYAPDAVVHLHFTRTGISQRGSLRRWCSCPMRMTS